MIDHSSCDHEKTSKARAKCRASRANPTASPRANPEPALVEEPVWTLQKIRQMSIRAASEYQHSHPLDVRSFSGLQKLFYSEFLEKYGQK